MRNRISRAANKSVDQSANEALNNQGGNNYEFFVNIFRASFSLQNQLPGNAVRPYATNALPTFREQPGVEPATFLSGGGAHSMLCATASDTLLIWVRCVHILVFCIFDRDCSQRNKNSADSRESNRQPSDSKPCSLCFALHPLILQFLGFGAYIFLFFVYSIAIC